MNNGYSTIPHAKSSLRLARAALTLLAATSLLCWTAPTADARSKHSGHEKRLRAGQFQWFDNAIRNYVPLMIVVSLSTQRARVYQGDVLIGETSISSGRRGYETPAGTYTILQKKRFHRSNLYDDAPMPYMLRLTWGGVAIHAGHVPGRPASHGCIRMPSKFVSKLFGLAGYDTTVIVTHRDARGGTSSMRANEMREPEIVAQDPLDLPYQP